MTLPLPLGLRGPSVSQHLSFNRVLLAPSWAKDIKAGQCPAQRTNKFNEPRSGRNMTPKIITPATGLDIVVLVLTLGVAQRYSL
jgi:hypothetical protein